MRKLFPGWDHSTDNKLITFRVPITFLNSSLMSSSGANRGRRFRGALRVERYIGSWVGTGVIDEVGRPKRQPSKIVVDAGPTG